MFPVAESKESTEKLFHLLLNCGLDTLTNTFYVVLLVDFVNAVRNKIEHTGN